MQPNFWFFIIWHFHNIEKIQSIIHSLELVSALFVVCAGFKVIVVYKFHIRLKLIKLNNFINIDWSYLVKNILGGMDWALVSLEFGCTCRALLFQRLATNKEWMEVILIETGQTILIIVIPKYLPVNR